MNSSQNEYKRGSEKYNVQEQNEINSYLQFNQYASENKGLFDNESIEHR